MSELLVASVPVEWERYLLTDDDLARLIQPDELTQKALRILRGDDGYEGVPLPWSRAEQHVRLRRGKVSVWGGITHHGKTAVLKQVALHLARMDEPVCIASLEELPEETYADMARMALGPQSLQEEWMQVFSGWAQGKIWLYDQQGMIDANRLLALVAYCAQEKGVTHFIIDSLMRLGIPADDYEAQRVFFNRVTNYAKALNVHIHVVTHMRKQKDEENVPNIFDIRGAAAIAEQADNVFVVWRDKRDDRPSHDPSGLLVVEKQRGRPNWLGRIRLWHDHASGQFLNGERDPLMQFLPDDAAKELDHAGTW